jgi:hypothetical protein
MMKKLMKFLAAVFDRVFSVTRPSTPSSKLIGMYLHQANSINYFSNDFKTSRERQNGRYAVKRERD